MTKLMARYGIEGTRAGLEGSVAGNKESQYYTDKKTGKRRKRHGPAVQHYVSAVHKNPKRHMKLDAKRHGGYEPVGGTREIAEKYGTRGYIKRDPKSGEGVASMKISESRARPDDLKPPASKPRAVASRETTPESTADARSPTRSMMRPTQSLARTEDLVSKRPAVVSKPTPVMKSITFESEYFVEV